MSTMNDTQAELTPSCMCRDNRDLGNLLCGIERFANPFSVESESLINIHTGRGATKEFADSLLDVEVNGQKKHDVFVAECTDDPGRFEKAIT